MLAVCCIMKKKNLQGGKQLNKLQFLLIGGIVDPHLSYVNKNLEQVHWFRQFS